MEHDGTEAGPLGVSSPARTSAQPPTSCSACCCPAGAQTSGADPSLSSACSETRRPPGKWKGYPCKHRCSSEKAGKKQATFTYAPEIFRCQFPLEMGTQTCLSPKELGKGCIPDGWYCSGVLFPACFLGSVHTPGSTAQEQ